MARASRRTSVAAITRLANEEADLRPLRAAVLEQLRHAMEFDWYAWVLTDPRTTVGTDPLARVPDLAALPRVIRLKYLTATNRWSTIDSVAVLGDRAEESLLWRKVLRHYGVADVASLAFRDRFGCWAFLDLWSRRRFDQSAVALLREVVDLLTAVLRRGQARTFHEVPTAQRPASGPVVLLLDRGLHIVGQTAGSADWLRLLLPSSLPSPVPACAYNVAGQLLALEHGVDDHEPMGRLHLADGAWVTLRAARVKPGDLFAVTIEPTAPEDRLEVYGRAHGLTERERQLLDHLARGTDTVAASRAMHLSPHTVQDHLKSVFAKTGTHSRRSLLSFALGVRTDASVDPSAEEDLAGPSDQRQRPPVRT